MAFTFSLPPIRSYKDLAAGAAAVEDVSGVSDEHASISDAAKNIDMRLIIFIL
jgi:hypothetical protein